MDTESKTEEDKTASSHVAYQRNLLKFNRLLQNDLNQDDKILSGNVGFCKFDNCKLKRFA